MYSAQGCQIIESGDLKIIIVDLQQIMVANLMIQIGKMKKEEVDESLLRHMILNSIRSFKTAYSSDYGEIVIACDSKNSWRREAFPYYKANRRQQREEEQLFDWKLVFESFGKIKEELKQFMPYRLVQVEGAEADDIIATLVHKFGPEGKRILILSGDKDFIQLHNYMGVEQYDPVRKKKIYHAYPDLYKQEHIIRGDKGDGIPSILMGDNSLVLRERQKPLRESKINSWLGKRPEEYCDHMSLQRWYRNQLLIDLDMVPKSISEKIIQEYESQAGKDRKSILNYFIKHRLKNMMEKINDF